MCDEDTLDSVHHRYASIQANAHFWDHKASAILLCTHTAGSQAPLQTQDQAAQSRGVGQHSPQILRLHAVSAESRQCCPYAMMGIRLQPPVNKGMLCLHCQVFGAVMNTTATTVQYSTMMIDRWLVGEEERCCACDLLRTTTQEPPTLVLTTQWKESCHQQAPLLRMMWHSSVPPQGRMLALQEGHWPSLMVT